MKGWGQRVQLGFNNIEISSFRVLFITSPGEYSWNTCWQSRACSRIIETRAFHLQFIRCWKG